MDTFSNRAALVDTDTGSSFTRFDIGGATMTVEITEHPYRRLKGKAFVTLTDDIVALVDDDEWERVLGLRLKLPGGCEVDVSDARIDRALEDIEECDEDWQDAAKRRPGLFAILPSADGGSGRYGLMVPLVVNDADLPRVRVLVRLEVLGQSFQAIARGAGVKARAEDGTATAPTICRHTKGEMGKTKCRGCFRRWWIAEARKVGLPDG